VCRRSSRSPARATASVAPQIAATGTAAAKEELRAAAKETAAIRGEAKDLVHRALPDSDARDTDYVFIGFVLHYVPAGLVGLLVAVILAAAMSSISSELAALGTTTTIDLYKRFSRTETTAGHDLLVSKLFTAAWGVVAIAFGGFAALLGNLIQAVNILGSLFYGTMLGLFVVAFFLKRVRATPVLIGAFVAEATVLTLFFATDLGFLWFNVIGCAAVVAVSLALSLVRR